jgi:hypothetical protein
LEFAKAEFFEVMKARSQLRLLAIGIMGAVVPIFISLLFQVQPNAQVSPNDVLSISLAGLSFVFLLLGHTFIGQSRRYDALVIHLRDMHVEFLRYLNIPKERKKRHNSKELLKRIYLNYLRVYDLHSSGRWLYVSFC